MKSLVLLLAGVCLHAVPQEEILHVRAEGAASGTDRNAVRRAVENAKTAAIVECLETISASQDLRVFQPIFARISDYVPSYEVLNEKKAKRQTYVEIDAEVRNDRLRRDVAALVFPGYLSPPRVALFVTVEPGEGATGGLADAGDVETKLADGLRKREFEIVDAERIRAALSDEQREALRAGKDEPAAYVGRSLAADVVVVVVVRCESETPPTGGNLLTNRAEFRVRLVRADTGARFDDLVASAVVHSVDPAEGRRLAIEDACAKTAAEIVPSCVLGLLASVSPDTVMLTVEGLGDARRGADVGVAAAGDIVDDIVEVIEAGVGEQGGGGDSVERVYVSDELARLRVRFDGPVTPFTDWLSEMDFPGFRLEAKRIVNRDVTLRVVVSSASAKRHNPPPAK